MSGRALARLSGRSAAAAFADGADPRLAAIADQFTAELQADDGVTHNLHSREGLTL